MKKSFLEKHKGEMILGISLVLLSVFFYFIHYLIFAEPHHIFIYLVGDIAFVPMEVLLVTLILHRVLEKREKKAMLTKMNMVIGSFFTEVGKDFISKIIQFAECTNTDAFLFDDSWSAKDFEIKSKEALVFNYECNLNSSNAQELHEFLKSKKTFLLGLLCNPNLMEHEGFTELLWAVSHLGEELSFRKQLDAFSADDKKHVEGDMQRAFSRVLSQWLLYTQHLKKHYPYLYSLEVRVNPFLENPCAEIKS